jgi:hypothetical protein
VAASAVCCREFHIATTKLHTCRQQARCVECLCIRALTRPYVADKTGGSVSLSAGRHCLCLVERGLPGFGS